MKSSFFTVFALFVYVATASASQEAPSSLEERFSFMAQNASQKEELLGELSKPRDAVTTLAQLRALRNLHIHVSGEELRQLETTIGSASHDIALELAGLIGDQGDPSSADAATDELKPLIPRFPRRDLDIHPTDGSDWPFSRWSELPEFADYEFLEDGSIQFRGLNLKSGDLFLVDLNDDSSDLYTAFTTNESMYGHFAFFAILERKGLRFPAAIEIHERGLRAVPLRIFLSPRFAAYVQVYRLKARPQDWDRKISDLVETALGENHPYDFDSRDEIDGPLTCTGVGSLILERTGVAPVSLRSQVDERIFPSFAQLDYHLKEILAPTDYMRDSRFESIGSIDNSELTRALAHQLVSGAVVNDLRELLLDPNRLPGEFGFDLWAVKEAQAHTPTGELLLSVEGFTEADFPSGPASLIALMPLMDQAMGSAADELTPEIANVIQLGGFPGVEELKRRLAPETADATSRIRDWFISR